eukprot:UN08818
MRDVNVKFRRDEAWYMYLGHAENGGHTIIRKGFD